MGKMEDRQWQKILTLQRRDVKFKVEKVFKFFKNKKKLFEVSFDVEDAASSC